MWQTFVVMGIVVVAAGLTGWRFYEKFTGKSSCCGGSGGGCTCRGGKSCGSGELRELPGCGCAR